MSEKKQKLFLIILSASVFLGGILYYFADRYLIEHVESAVQTTTVSAATLETTSEIATPNTDSENTKSEISVEKIVTGSGENTITYYVADIKTDSGTALKTAFAKEEFGNNIIEYTSNIAASKGARFAINGDYYGFREDGIIIRNGVLYRNLPAREGLAVYQDGTMKVYDETKTTGESLLAEGVVNTFSFGPALIADGAILEGIDEVEIDTNFGNHSIQGNQPRTAVGMIEKKHYVFIVVDGRSPGYSRGMTLSELAQVMKDYGCVTAYNMDGGGSSVMYFNGEVVSNPLGKNRERGTSDIIYFK